MSTIPNNDNETGVAEIKEKSDHEFAKAFIYDATSKDDEYSLRQVKEEIKENKFFGDIILPKINEQNKQIKQSIEEQLVANNNEFTRYPSDYIHARMCSHVNEYKTLNEGASVVFGEEKFVIYKIFDKYTGLIGEAKTFDFNVNKVLVYLAILYLNKARKQLVLTAKGIEASIFKSHFSSNDALSNSLKGVLCNQTVPQLYAVSGDRVFVFLLYLKEGPKL
jgi:hypothetical protein